MPRVLEAPAPHRSAAAVIEDCAALLDTNNDSVVDIGKLLAMPNQLGAAWKA